MILHIFSLEKFTQPFIDIVNKNFSATEHQFIILNKFNNPYKLKRELSNVYEICGYKKIRGLIKLICMLYQADKIIIHGLTSSIIVNILFLQPWLLKKSYWFMWGGDFYFPEKQSWIKKQVIKKIGHIVTYIKGDYELVQKWYGAKGKYHECFKYPSNLYKEYNIKPKKHSIINIQLGNSADPTNNHIYILKKLVKYKDENISIFVPLSYGNKLYAQEVIKYGKKIFANKFIPLTEFMPFEKYLDFLSRIDIAIFAHNRQQAMGNIITLLGLGKKVYMRSDITPWKFFKDIGVKVFDVANIEIDLINEKAKKENQQKIREYFSQKNYLTQLQNLFGVK